IILVNSSCGGMASGACSQEIRRSGETGGFNLVRVVRGFCCSQKRSGWVQLRTSRAGLAAIRDSVKKSGRRDSCSSFRRVNTQHRRTDGGGDWLRDRRHTALGPGLLESVYRDCLVIELQANGVTCEVEKFVSITYRGQRVPVCFQLQRPERPRGTQACRPTGFVRGEKSAATWHPPPRRMRKDFLFS